MEFLIYTFVSYNVYEFVCREMWRREINYRWNGEDGLQYISGNKLQYALFLSWSACLLCLALLLALFVCHLKAMFTPLNGV